MSRRRNGERSRQRSSARSNNSRFGGIGCDQWKKSFQNYSRLPDAPQTPGRKSTAARSNKVASESIQKHRLQILSPKLIVSQSRKLSPRFGRRARTTGLLVRKAQTFRAPPAFAGFLTLLTGQQTLSTAIPLTP